MREHSQAIVALALLAFAAGCSSRDHDVATHDGLGLGQSRDAIIGGEEDNAHFYVVGVGDNVGPWCSATLISRQTVITAAHCAFGITRVFTGKNWEYSTPADMEVLHPEWLGDVDTPDVAMVRLTSPSDLQPAPLLRATLDNSATYIGPDFEFVGYGATDGMTGLGGGTRRHVAFPITAIGPTTTVDNIPVREEFVYYEHPTKNTCFGDSGGPTFFLAPTTGMSSVENHAAVTSWGDQFCEVYGVQARTDQPEIDQWIQATIDLFEGPDPCKNDGICEETCNVDGQVLDPDCQADHCEADGLCAYACVKPYDPDCPEIFDPCGADGYCNDGCSPLDPDCDMTTTVVTTPSVNAVVATTLVASSTSTTMTTTGTGVGGAGPKPAQGTPRSASLYGRGCSCGLAPKSSQIGAWLALAGVGLALGRRRRRQSR